MRSATTFGAPLPDGHTCRGILTVAGEGYLRFGDAVDRHLFPSAKPNRLRMMNNAVETLSSGQFLR